MIGLRVGGKRAGPDIRGVRLDALSRRGGEVTVFSNELRRCPRREAENVVEDKDLSVTSTHLPRCRSSEWRSPR